MARCATDHLARVIDAIGDGTAAFERGNLAHLPRRPEEPPVCPRARAADDVAGGVDGGRPAPAVAGEGAEVAQPAGRVPQGGVGLAVKLRLSDHLAGVVDAACAEGGTQVALAPLGVP